MGAKQSKNKNEITDDVILYESIHDDWPWVWGMRDPTFLDWKVGLKTEDEIQSQSLRQQDLPVSITPRIFLGNARSVSSIIKLKEHGITAVLNMAGPLAIRKTTIETFKENGISYKQINAEDEVEYPLLQNHWQEALDFIESSLTTNESKCVVNCNAGMNRSGLVVAAYYMLKTRTPVLETVKHVRFKRGNVALMNEGFQQQLVVLARKNNLLGAKPGTEESIIHQVPQNPENDWIFSSTMTNKIENLLDRL